MNNPIIPTRKDKGPNINVKTNARKYLILNGFTSFIFSLIITLPSLPTRTISPLNNVNSEDTTPKVVHATPSTSIPIIACNEYSSKPYITKF